MKKTKTLLLRTSSEYVLNKIRNAGISVCICSEFEDVIALDAHLTYDPYFVARIKEYHNYIVHGIGCGDENDYQWNKDKNDYIDPYRNGDPRNDYLASKRKLNQFISEAVSSSRYEFIDCGYNVDYFIKLIKEYQYEIEQM